MNVVVTGDIYSSDVRTAGESVSSDDRVNVMELLTVASLPLSLASSSFP